jgi:hypothetical protein
MESAEPRSDGRGRSKRSTNDSSSHASARCAGRLGVSSGWAILVDKESRCACHTRAIRGRLHPRKGPPRRSWARPCLACAQVRSTVRCCSLLFTAIHCGSSALLTTTAGSSRAAPGASCRIHSGWKQGKCMRLWKLLSGLHRTHPLSSSTSPILLQGLASSRSVRLAPLAVFPVRHVQTHTTAAAGPLCCPSSFRGTL